ncbi:putative Type I site-specific deoxyribonuclease [Vibrio chagasii]|nr:putative Type I site-specific deoxyribonuclease [Vibrio chagasii]
MSWPLVKLEDICDLQNGYAFKSSDYVERSNTLSCRMSNIRPGGKFDIEYNARYLPDDFADKYQQFLLKEDDVIIAMTDLADSPKILGVPTVVKTNGKSILLNQRVGKLVIKDHSQIYFPYLQHVLNAPKTRSVYKRFAGGGLQINLGKKDLLSVEIPLPPLTEQKRIAAILDKADAIRQKRKQAIDLADEFLRSVFLDMFGDPVTNPKGWDYVTLEELADKSKYSIKAGPFGSALKKEDYVESGYKIYGQEQVIRDDLNFGNYYIDEEKYESLKTCSVSYGDLLISLVGSFGKISVVPKVFEPGIINPRLMKVKFDNTKVNPYFIKYLLTTKEMLRKIDNMSHGGTMGILNVSKVKALEVIHPSLKQQLDFLKLKDQVEKIKTEEPSILQTELFQSLSQKAFSGEL